MSRAVLVTLAVAAGLVAPALATPAWTGAGVEVRFEVEASHVSTRRVSSDRLAKTIGQYIPIISFFVFLSGPPTDVFEHSKGLTGTFLGEEVSGELKVIEVRRGQSNFQPATLRLEVRGSALELVFGSPSQRGYRVWTVPGKSTGVFAGVEAGGYVRVVGLSDRFSILRGEVVIGWPGREEAASALVSAGWQEDVARSALAATRVSVVPFPEASPDNPPATTQVRWIRSRAAQESVDLSLAMLVGTDAMPLVEGGQRARSAKVRVTVAGVDGVRTLHEGQVSAGEQIWVSSRVLVPCVLLVTVGPKTVFQVSITEESP